MNTLCTKNQERLFRHLLLPFKVYVIVAPILLIHSVWRAHSAQVELGAASDYLLVGCAICVPFFVLAALVQFYAHWRRPALVSFLFAMSTATISVILWQLFVSGFVK
jgi:hypothetical protein